MEYKYSFSITEKLIIEFGNTINLSPDLAEKTKSSYLRTYPSLLHSVFAAIDLETMSRESLGQTLVACADIYSNRRLRSILTWVKRFLLFLLDINFYSDRRFDFLHCYELYLRTSESQLIIDILLRKVYQKDCTAKAVNDFLNSLLAAEGFSALTRQAHYTEAKKYLPIVLHKVDINDMDRFQVGQALLDSSDYLAKKEQILVQKYTRRFLYFLIDRVFYQDKRFDYLQHYRDYLELQGPVLSDLLVCDHPFQYRIATLQNGHNLLLFIGSASESVCDVVAEAFGIFTHGFDEIKSFNAHFDESLYPYVVASVDDFSWQTFITQCAYLRKKQASRWAYSYLVTIYNLIAQKYNNQIFNEAMISTAILTRQSLAQSLYSGYELVALNPAEKPPAGDKLLVCLRPGPAKTNTSYYASNSKAIDFSVVATPVYRNLLKDYLWHAAPSFDSKISTCTQAKLFFDYLDHLHKKKILSIYYVPHNSIRVLPGECMAYVQHIRQHYHRYELRFC